jgi:hypothetical protein
VGGRLSILYKNLKKFPELKNKLTSDAKRPATNKKIEYQADQEYIWKLAD